MLQKAENQIRVSDIEQIVDEKIREALMRELPHECWTCIWFSRLEGKTNKSCNYEGKLLISKNQCLTWQLQHDPNKRRRRMY